MLEVEKHEHNATAILRIITCYRLSAGSGGEKETFYAIATFTYSIFVEGVKLRLRAMIHHHRLAILVNYF